MIKLFLFLPFLAFAAEPTAQWTAGNLQVKTLENKTMTLDSFKLKDKPTLVIFGCNHCPFVKAWAGRISKIGELAVKKGIAVIMINSNDDKSSPDDSFEKMKEFKDIHHFVFPYVMDETSDVARRFGATRTPEAFLFNAQGVRVYHGAIDDNGDDEKSAKQHYLKSAVEAVTTKKAISPTETKFIGCSIKFRKG